MAFLRRIWNKWQNLLHDEKLKHKIYVIIFESDTPMGKLFDVALIGFIVLSILVVIAESIKSWDTRYRALSAGVGVCFYFLFYVRVCVEALLFSPTAEVCSEFFRYSGFAGYLTSIYRLAFRHGTLSAGDPHFPVDSCVPYL